MAIVNNGSRMNILIFNEILMYLVYQQIIIMSLFLHDSFRMSPYSLLVQFYIKEN
jgi:hypothetical protein